MENECWINEYRFTRDLLRFLLLLERGITDTLKDYCFLAVPPTIERSKFEKNKKSPLFIKKLKTSGIKAKLKQN